MSNEESRGAPFPLLRAAPRRRARFLVAVLIGLTVGVGVLLHLAHSHIGAADFTFTWRAARTILTGRTPYVPIRFDAPYPYYSGFAYPLTAALVGVPFAALSAPIAGSIFFAISTGLLAFAVTREGYGRLPLFVSAPFINAAAWCTWSPLLTAAALLPALGWAMSVKP